MISDMQSRQELMRSFNHKVVRKPAPRWARIGLALLIAAFQLGLNACQVLDAKATGAAGGLVAASPTLNFGSVAVGSSKSLSETITNNTAAALTVSAALSGADYTISGLASPATLAAGQSASFTVTFAPATVGASSGSITLTSNDPQAGSTITLSGDATPGSQLTAPASLAFGSLKIGSTKSLPVTVQNIGTTSVTLSQISITGAGFSLAAPPAVPLTLSPSQTLQINVSFAPASAGAVSGQLTFSGDAAAAVSSKFGRFGNRHRSGTNTAAATAGITVVVGLTGTGLTLPTLTAAPANVSFGSVTVGSKQSRTVTLTNTGGSTATISQASVSGTGYTLGAVTLPAQIASGQSLNLTVSWQPAAAGNASGNLSVTSDATNPSLSVPLSGAGVTAGALTASPSSVSFGNVTVGSNQSQSFSVTNSGGTAVSITAASASGAGFTLTSPALPLSLAAGQSANFTAKFTPATATSATGSATITSNASNPSLSVPLSGTGIAAGTLAASPSSLSFGSVTLGNSKPLSVTVTNTGGTSVTITQGITTGTGYSLGGWTLPITLAAGQSTSATVTFAPTAAGVVSGNMAVTSNASNPNLSIALSATGVTQGTISPNPASLTFGSVAVGASKTLSEVLTNSGGTSLTISLATPSGAGFSVSGLTLPVKLNPGQSQTFSVIFTPASGSAVTGNLAVASDASNPSLNIALSGTGTTPGQLGFNPASLNFGNVTVGANKSLTTTLSASGGAVTITAASPGTSEFTVTGPAFPVTLAAGQSTTMTVKFTPQASGAASDSISFTSNASNGPLSLALAGSGTPAPVHSVDLSWAASASAVAGYNIYRGGVSGGPYTIVNTLLNATTAFTDPNVSAGQTYFYVVTAEDSNAVESGRSNEARADIPTP
jgi:hypothetical protein